MSSVTLDEVRAVAKPRDAWWTVLLVDPVAIRLVRWAVQYRWITPNRLTAAAFGLGLVAAVAFAQGGRWWLALGAAAYHAAFVLDCMDGKIARLTSAGTPVGQWLDFMLDRITVTICAIGLFGGQYLVSHEATYLWLGAVVVFLNLFHQLNGQIMTGALEGMRHPGQPAQTAATQPGRLSAAFARNRAKLARRRIRADVFSAIEFQMIVFVVAPLVGPIVPTATAACALLLLFEAAAVAKFIRRAETSQRQGETAIVTQARPHELEHIDGTVGRYGRNITPAARQDSGLAEEGRRAHVHVDAHGGDARPW